MNRCLLTIRMMGEKSHIISKVIPRREADELCEQITVALKDRDAPQILAVPIGHDLNERVVIPNIATFYIEEMS